MPGQSFVIIQEKKMATRNAVATPGVRLAQGGATGTPAMKNRLEQRNFNEKQRSIVVGRRTVKGPQTGWAGKYS
jgi:hypothetical protein